VPRTSRGAQLLLEVGFVRSLDGQNLTIALPSEEMRQNTELHRPGTAQRHGTRVQVAAADQWAVDPTLASVATPRRRRRLVPIGRAKPTRRATHPTNRSSSSTPPAITSSPRCSPGRRRSRELPAAAAGRRRRTRSLPRRRTQVGPAHRVLADAPAQRGRRATRRVIDEMKTKLSFCERCCNIAETGGSVPSAPTIAATRPRSASWRIRRTWSRSSAPARSTARITCCTAS
jgi:hypothetical protein